MQSAPPTTSAWSMYRAIVGIGALCAVLIVGVYQSTEARIRDNRARALQRAITDVLPQARDTAPVTLDGDGALVVGAAATATALPAFLGYAADGRLVGVAITAEGMGYQDNIRVMYAYSPTANAVVGFTVLESKETPGLGDRVEKEPHFLANFARLDATLDSSGNALGNAIVTVKQGSKEAPWQIDGITGATITSVAIGALLNESVAAWAPALQRRRDAIARRNPTEEP